MQMHTPAAMPLSPDVAFLVEDEDLGAQPYTILRRTGKWIKGTFTETSRETLTKTGLLVPKTEEQLQLFPEGERKKGMITVYTRFALHLTEGEDVSDEIIWDDAHYRIVLIDPYTDYGFCIAHASRR